VAHQLPDLRALRPEAYVARWPIWPAAELLAFEARTAEDFDWLETMIHQHGYYEHEGVWSLELSPDKRAMAEIMAAFRPRRALELGCATGPVLHYLCGLGLHAEGVEVSRMAVERAFPDVRDRIHHGDLLALGLDGDFDLVFGLDVFEHLNPNRLPAYLARLAGLLQTGGYLYVALPAFGDDPVFGLAFPLYLRDWYRDVFLGQNFRLLHADGRGYPLNGHLVWADSRWWVRQFERAGFQRDEAIERAVHARYDRFFDGYAPARKAFYVFARDGAAGTRDAIIDRLLSAPSEALGEAAGSHPPGAHLLSSDTVFAAGWHQLEGDARGPFRWSERRAHLALDGLGGRRLSLLVSTEHPGVGRRPVTVRVTDLDSGAELARLALPSREPRRVEVPIQGPRCRLEVAVDPTWIPRLVTVDNGDPRELGVAVRDVRVLEPHESAPGAPVEPSGWRRWLWPGRSV
jgi:SAM-dependent methyltransferase